MPLNRISIASALEREGHQVDRVTHLGLAAQNADLTDVDAIVIGLEQPFRRERFIERVRARDSRVPVIVLLESHTAWQTNRSEALGATVVLRRPLQVAELVRCLTDLTRKAKLAPIPAPPARSGRRTGSPALV